MDPYRDSTAYIKKCQICNGSGLIVTYPMGCRDEEVCSCKFVQNLSQHFEHCSTCKGDGSIRIFPMGCPDDITCPICNGSGIL